MYGSELWNLNCSYVDYFKVAWRKVKRRIWKLPCNTHNAIVQNLTYNIDDQLDVRTAKFTHMCLNHHNDVCRSISFSNFHASGKIHNPSRRNFTSSRKNLNPSRKNLNLP